MNLGMVTAAVAVYGALLSTWTAAQKHVANKRRIKVGLSVGLGVNSHAPSGPWFLLITAMNTGNRTVRLVYGGVRLPTGESAFLPDQSGDIRLPADLEPGKSCMLFIETADLARTLAEKRMGEEVKLVGVYRDALDKTYTSKPLSFKPGTCLSESRN